MSGVRSRREREAEYRTQTSVTGEADAARQVTGRHRPGTPPRRARAAAALRRCGATLTLVHTCRRRSAASASAWRTDSAHAASAWWRASWADRASACSSPCTSACRSTWLRSSRISLCRLPSCPSGTGVFLSRRCCPARPPLHTSVGQSGPTLYNKSSFPGAIYMSNNGSRLPLRKRINAQAGGSVSLLLQRGHHANAQP